MPIGSHRGSQRDTWPRLRYAVAHQRLRIRRRPALRQRDTWSCLAGLEVVRKHEHIVDPKPEGQEGEHLLRVIYMRYLYVEFVCKYLCIYAIFVCKYLCIYAIFVCIYRMYIIQSRYLRGCGIERNAQEAREPERRADGQRDNADAN
eukprot:COSAG03_NODE_4587_length_1499_cov_3.406758_2_plen_147_part_00